MSVENNNLKYLRQRSSKSLLTKAYAGRSAIDHMIYSTVLLAHCTSIDWSSTLFCANNLPFEHFELHLIITLHLNELHIWFAVVIKF